MRVVWFAGSQGWGKIHRAAAVLRRWPRLEDELLIVHLGPYPPPLADWGLDGLRVTTNRQAADACLADLLVVDGAPGLWQAPILEAARSSGRVAVLHRSAPDHAIDVPGALHVAIEPEATEGEPIWPILLCDPDEILERDRARTLLGIAPDAWVTLVVRSRLYNAPDLAKLLRPLATPDRPIVELDAIRHYPAVRYLRAADVVAGVAGGRLRDECAALGLPHLLVGYGPDQRARETCRLEDIAVLVMAGTRESTIHESWINRAGELAERLVSFAG